MAGLTGQRAQSDPRINKASRPAIEMSRPIRNDSWRICVNQPMSSGRYRGSPH